MKLAMILCAASVLCFCVAGMAQPEDWGDELPCQIAARSKRVFSRLYFLEKKATSRENAIISVMRGKASIGEYREALLRAVGREEVGLTRLLLLDLEELKQSETEILKTLQTLSEALRRAAALANRETIDLFLEFEADPLLAIEWLQEALAHPKPYDDQAAYQEILALLRADYRATTKAAELAAAVAIDLRAPAGDKRLRMGIYL